MRKDGSEPGAGTHSIGWARTGEREAASRTGTAQAKADAKRRRRGRREWGVMEGLIMGEGKDSI